MSEIGIERLSNLISFNIQFGQRFCFIYQKRLALSDQQLFSNSSDVDSKL